MSYILEKLEYHIYRLSEENEQKRKSSKVGTALKGAAAGLGGYVVGSNIGALGYGAGTKAGRKEFSKGADVLANIGDNMRKGNLPNSYYLNPKAWKKKVGTNFAKKVMPGIIKAGKVGGITGAATGLGAYAAHKYNQYKKAQQDK